MLNVNDINVFYGSLQALWDVSFKVNKSEIVTIIGSNGSGKTTILKTISGLIRPTSGSIEFLNQRINTLPAHQIVELGIAHVPEGRRLFPNLSVMENLMMGAYIYKGISNQDETLEWIFQLFPRLKERKNQAAQTLSGGEQQMLAISRGLMSKPKMLLFDEPSLGLEPKLVLKVFEMIKKINEEGITVLLNEQNVHHALELAERGYVLETGRIVLQGEGKKLQKTSYVKKAYLGI